MVKQYETKKEQERTIITNMFDSVVSQDLIANYNILERAKQEDKLVVKADDLVELLRVAKSLEDKQFKVQNLVCLIANISSPLLERSY